MLHSESAQPRDHVYTHVCRRVDRHALLSAPPQKKTKKQKTDQKKRKKQSGINASLAQKNAYTSMSRAAAAVQCPRVQTRVWTCV